MTRALTTGPDAQWAAARDGRKVVLLDLSRGGAPVGQLELASDDYDLALVGPPSVVAVVTREPARVTLYEPPYLEAVTHLDLEAPLRLAAVAGPRLVLVSADASQVTLVRTQGRALGMQKIDPGSPVEFAVGLERNQVLLALLKKLEVWDAVSGRPLLRPQLALPPAPRTVGAAQGHLWAMGANRDEVFIYRLSDGRPFRHHAGSPIEAVISHPASPLIVLATQRGLIRLHCFAHSLLVVDGAPWTPGTPLALTVAGDDISLVGWPSDAAEPWRIALGGSAAPALAAEPAHGSGEPRTSEPRGPAHRTWRDSLVAYASELVRGVDGELPIVAVDTELGELAQRLGLSGAARRGLIALYALYLVGEPALAISRLARALGDWSEPLGQGDLAALALVDRTGGKVALRRPVTDLLDGAAPSAIRLAGSAATLPRPGAFRVSRDGRADAAIESELATQLGRIAIAEGDLPTALLEARLHGATCISFAAPGDQPRPWPRGAGLVLVLYGTQSAWVADVPNLAQGS
jgi:hypothetical protein